MTYKPVGPVGWSLRIAAPVSLFRSQDVNTDMLNHRKDDFFWRMDDSISLGRSYSLSIFLILWLFSTKLWNVVFWVYLVFWAGLQRGMSRDVTVFCFALGKKRRKRVYRLLCPPCSFSSFSYNPSDKTWLVTIRTGFIFKEILKKYQLEPLSPSHQPKKPLRKWN